MFGQDEWEIVDANMPMLVLVMVFNISVALALGFTLGRITKFGPMSWSDTPSYRPSPAFRAFDLWHWSAACLRGCPARLVSIRPNGPNGPS
jgi:hypothetical protein